MLTLNKDRQCVSRVMRLSAAAMGIAVSIAGTGTAQDLPLLHPQSTLTTTAIPFWRFGGVHSFAPAISAERLREDPPAAPASTQENPVPPGETRRITLQQVKQQGLAHPAANPFERLGQLSIEAAKQHRLGVRADYFPKLGATAANLHYSEFLGQVLAVRRPFAGTTVQVAVPLFSQNETIAALTFVQPVTPLFQVRQAVRIARADERIAIAKAGLSGTKSAYAAEIEETYFRLSIAQRRVTAAEAKLRNMEGQPVVAGSATDLIRVSSRETELVEARKTILTAENEARELTASLNGMMGWPAGTKLELVPPDPLVENVTLGDVVDKPAVANPDVIEAQQTVVKARAASVLSKLAYVPTVAAVGGYMFQNAIPLVQSNFGYGGVIASYTLFDFGKRERAVKEARAQLEMAELALQMTQAKVAANVKKAYLDLERARQLSQVAQKMGSSLVRLTNVASTPESPEVKAARAEVEMEMLESDLAHRQAFARLNALVNPKL